VPRIDHDATMVCRRGGSARIERAGLTGEGGIGMMLANHHTIVRIRDVSSVVERE
jgi:hypothetical protein